MENSLRNENQKSKRLIFLFIYKHKDKENKEKALLIDDKDGNERFIRKKNNSEKVENFVADFVWFGVSKEKKKRVN